MQTRFTDVLEAVEELPTDEKEMLIDILQNRLKDLRRKELKAAVEKSKKDFADGKCQPMTVDEIMREVSS
ncbi:hypothetical protein BH24ACI2_BH24ACI2_00130 [soil metagenome]|jgi:hypothetical protein|nr:hypothetical protein [Acidobacteriota bacterium]